MPLRRMCLVGVLALATGAAAGGDSRPPREAASTNREYIIRIEPGRPGRADSACIATMVKAGARDARGKELWKRPLVNDTAPGQIFIRNDGKFTITLDERGRGGARNAVVIYGEDGRLLRHFLITDLLSKDDWRHVRVAKRSLEWLDGARCRFDTPRNVFLIELAWGRSIVLDLQTLQIVRSTTDVPTGLLLDVPPQIIALLEPGSSPEDDTAGEETAATQPTDAGAPAAATTTAPAVGPPIADCGEIIEIDEQIIGGPDADQDASASAAAQAAGDEHEPAAAEAAPASQVVAPLPPPNPAAPANYIAWLNQFGEVAPEQDARPLYEAAIKSFVTFEGDQSLLNSALNGDAEALASPQVALWLEANRAALISFRQGAMLDHKSWALHSDDGAMISVLLPDLSPMRQLAKASILDGRRLAAQGRAGEAADRVLDALAAGAHVGAGATLIENLVGTAMQTQGAEALLDLQATAPDGAIDYTRLAREAEAAAQPVAPYGDVLIGERLFALDTLQRLYKPGENGTFVPDRRKIAELTGMVGSGQEADVEAALDAWMPTDKPGFDAVVADVNAYFDRASAAVDAAYLEGRPQLEALDRSIPTRRETNPLLAQLAPSLTRAHLVRTRGEATRRAAVLVANLNAYRQNHGDYPDALDAFAGREFATDPFTGGNFVYRREGDSFRLYSTAANGVDDGGAHDPKAESGDVLYWPRPPRQ